MLPEVQFRHQQRQSLALKVTPDGVVVLLPCGLNADSPQVRTFVQAGLQKLPEPQPVPPDERLTRAEVRALVADWLERIGVTVRRVQVRAMRRKWASCSSRGTLTLSTDLLRLPRDLVEYVVCHELLHLRVPAHGKGWRALMGVYLPDWRERERRLAGWVVDRQQEVH
jgi:hypothetical protein